MKHSTTYLYGVEPSEFADLPYTEALIYKRNSAKQLISTLMDTHHSKRDEERVSAVFSAIKFNQQLLEEIT